MEKVFALLALSCLLATVPAHAGLADAFIAGGDQALRAQELQMQQRLIDAQIRAMEHQRQQARQSQEPARQAVCSPQTYIINNTVLFCTVCCVGNSCTTTCL